MTTDAGADSAAAARAIAEGDVDLPLQVPETGVTEILVHGVGGATPPAMLDETAVRQVTGDEVAGMWRGTDRDVARAGDQRWHREAYSWGGLTSRTAISALWLLLTPFALFNIAGWMALGRPNTAEQRPDWRVAYQQALVRVLGLFATLTYVLFVAQIAMDFGTWQCTQVSDCRLHDWPRGVSPMLAAHPARAAVVAAIVPLLGIAGLSLLSRRTTRQYEDYQPEHAAAGSAMLPHRMKERVDPVTATLTDQPFWTGAAYADRTRVLHLISSVLLVAFLLLAIANEGTRQPQVTSALLVAAVSAMAVVVVCAVWQRARGWLLDRRASRVAAWLLAYSLLITAAVMAWMQPIQAAPDRGVMPGMLEVFTVLVLAVLIFGTLHAVVAVSGRIAARRHGVAGLPVIPAPFIAVSVGACLLFAVWVGVAVWTARWLSPSAKPQTARVEANHLLYPTGYQVLAQVSFVGLVAVVVVMGAVLLVRRFSRYPRLDEETQVWNTYKLPDWIEASASWRRRVLRTKWTADLAFWIELALGLVSVLATVCGIGYALWLAERWVGWADTGRIVGAVGAFATGLTTLAWLSLRTKPVPPSVHRGIGDRVQVAVGLLALAAGIAAAVAAGAPLAGRFDERPFAPLPAYAWLPGTGLSSAFLAAIPIGAILLLRKAIRDQNTRRLVGTAWDVATFWPRAFHPLAPPSYAERAVPELTFRVRHLLGAGHAVLLLGHSQGAVLSTAALAQLTGLSPDDRSRLSVITYGNPVANLYMRWFPRYVNRAVIDASRGVAASTDGSVTDADVPLVNYFRHTDPVGRRLYAAPATQSRPLAEDRWLPDPPINRRRRGYGEPRVRGHAHGGYVRQKTFAEYITAEVKRLNELASQTGSGP